ncbi:Cysteine rich receptor like kinase [Quillaja saponaria]|uniref:Cysteine rich receptor like kinase n=1 Tax=Quillaja saponaria TaxID=32244 RepID=A0AAD7P933_QUISA|nr:Cysteine rich receptor like kinase [Quillaja saponaria]
MVYSSSFCKYIQLLVIGIACLSATAFADPPYTLCPNSASYANNSLFQNNLDTLLHSLPNNASVSKFYNASSGNIPDGVYSLYMCLDYITNEECKICISDAVEDIMRLCSNIKAAVVWEENCQLRYSNQNFFGKLDITENIGKDNVQKISQPENFKSVVNKTLINLTKEAASNLSANMYATGEVQFENKPIYALVQCTRDLSANDCSRCLLKAIADVLGCCFTSIGARLLSRSCYLRYEFYSFYRVDHDPFSSSTDSEAKGGGRNIRMTVILTTASALAITLLSASTYFLMKKKRTQKRKNDIVSQLATIHNFGERGDLKFHHQKSHGRNEKKAEEFPCIDLVSLSMATDKFSESNKLGQGGFGPVYKIQSGVHNSAGAHVLI